MFKNLFATTIGLGFLDYGGLPLSLKFEILQCIFSLYILQKYMSSSLFIALITEISFWPNFMIKDELPP